MATTAPRMVAESRVVIPARMKSGCGMDAAVVAPRKPVPDASLTSPYPRDELSRHMSQKNAVEAAAIRTHATSERACGGCVRTIPARRANPASATQRRHNLSGKKVVAWSTTTRVVTDPDQIHHTPRVA